VWQLCDIMRSIEIELRRQCRLTRETKMKLNKMYDKPIEVIYLIYYNQYRTIINGNHPRIESKTLDNSRPYFLKYSLETCYTSNELLANIGDVEGLSETIKHGLLAQKSIYVRDGLLTLYTLEYIEVTELYDKCILELEQPDDADESSITTYIDISFQLKLLNNLDDFTISIENVIHNPQVACVNDQTIPKVDGERGILVFHSGYEVYTSNTESVVIKPSIQKTWNSKLCFFLRGIPFVVERVNRVIVFIDLALSRYFNGDLRLAFINMVGAKFRETTPIGHGNQSSKANRILFQGYDREYITEHLQTDGKIFIRDGRLYKVKPELTVDLQYNKSIGLMSDRDGGVYEISKDNEQIILENGAIYECILLKDGLIGTILRPRGDKFYPNTRSTVSSIYSLMSR